jgi:hypothetical protein
MTYQSSYRRIDQKCVNFAVSEERVVEQDRRLSALSNALNHDWFRDLVSR